MKLTDLKNSTGTLSRLQVAALIVVVLVVAAVAGIAAGNWLAGKHTIDDRYRRLDESVGLGQRSGIAGTLMLNVEPARLAVRQGEPVKVRLVLTNRSRGSETINGWLQLSPAGFGSNQLPLKVVVVRPGARIRYRGQAAVFPPHAGRDFLTLGPGESKSIDVDLSRGVGGGRWDMSKPGVYNVEVWYETYLTGRYIGVKAWTGMTNHVVVRVTVLPATGGSR